MSVRKTDKFSRFGQYKSDLFNKLDFNFKAGKKILDIGCGDGSDAKIFIDVLGLDVYGIDVYKHDNIENVKGLKFKQAGMYQIPYEDEMFDYVFLHDVLHHIDKPQQRNDRHRAGLKEINRVVKKGGNIIVVEGNRYNPLFYPHMVIMLGHDHWRQSYFKNTIKEVFENVRFEYFECHVYPGKYVWFWKIYEKAMERFVPKCFLAYNIAIVEK